MTTEVLVDTHILHPEVASKFRDDERYVTGLGDHGVVPVKFALTCPARAAMRVQIGKDTQPGLPAELPQRSEPRSIEHDNAGFKAGWVEVIVVGKSHDVSAQTMPATKQEGATLVPSLSPACNFSDPSSPDSSGTTQPVLRRREGPNNRSK